jgi:hypothetical protein
MTYDVRNSRPGLGQAHTSISSVVQTETNRYP